MKNFALATLATATLMLSAPVQAVVTEVAPHQAIPGATPEPRADGGHALTRDDLEAFLDGVMADQLKWQHLVGATVAVVKDGQLLLAKGYGYADLERQIPVDAEQTLFRPGSVSKLFTWTALMQQVEQGKVQLDEDVNRYVTQFQIPATFPQPISVRNLLTHTEGLEDAGIGLVVEKPAQLVPLADFLGAHIPARVRPPLTDFNYGDQASYSNWGAALAGLIVQNVSGVPFDEYIERKIYQPLSMSSSTFREPLPPELAARMANGYEWEAGAFKRHGFELFHNIAPAGCMAGTATDMAKFMIAHLQDGAYEDRRILQKETAQRMHARSLGLNPHISGAALGFYETYVNGRRLISHAGDTEWFHSDLQLLLEDHVGLFVSYNTLPSQHIPMRRSLLQAFMDRYYPAKLPQVTAPKDFASRAARYAGWYRYNRHNYTHNEKSFELFSAIKVAPTAHGTLAISNLFSPLVTQWVEVKPDVFREIDGDAMIAFDGPETGAARYILNPIGVPFIGAYRIRWYETPFVHYFILGFGGLGFLGAIYGALRRWRTDRAGPALARRVRRLSALTGALLLSFFVGYFIAVTTLLNGGFDWPASFRWFLALPLMALPLTALLLWLNLRLWTGGAPTGFARLRYGIVALLCVAVLWSLNFWNLLGYKFA